MKALLAIFGLSSLTLTCCDPPPQLDVASREQLLRAAHAREATWSYLPVSYDREGNSAIMIRPVRDAGDGAWIVRAAECVASKGQWWDKPINVIDLKHETLGRCDGNIVHWDDAAVRWSCNMFRYDCGLR
jgi:hypothetical protein